MGKMGKKERLEQMVKEKEEIEKMSECSAEEEAKCTKRLNDALGKLKKSGMTDNDIRNFSFDCSCKK